MKRRVWWTGLLAMGMAIALFFHTPLLTLAQTSPPPQPTELRGVWLTNIDSDVLFSRRNLNRAIRKLSRLNFNTLYPTVWTWGYTLYPSPVAEQVIGRAVDPHPGLQNRDMLAELVERAHRRNMAVIPWFEFAFQLTAASEIATLHPDWITSRRDGTQIVMEGIYPRVWMNPFHPDVQQFILDLIEELVVKYPVDGIQLDDHFGLPSELGYDPYTVALYQQENQGRRPPNDPQDPTWVRWRADKITTFMSRVFSVIKSHNEDCIVSISPNSKDFAYRMSLQDWSRWERMGLVEELIVQDYFADINRFNQELNTPEVQQALLHIPVAIGILVGLKDRPAIPDTQIEQQVRAVRDRNFDGVSFFFYEFLHGREASLRSLFPTPATRPSVIE
jgi:uncharacterized lipoprotein YddW (UPF0748 family)